MTLKEIQELIKLVNKTDLSEFKMRQGDFELSIRTKNFSKASNLTQLTTSAIPMQAAMPMGNVDDLRTGAATLKEASSGDQTGEEDSTSDLLEIKSPIVGTFYRSAGPDKDAFVKVGDSVSTGDVVCIVEAMKLFNEIESEISGKIVKVLVEDASPVEYDQPLFLVDPKG